MATTKKVTTKKAAAKTEEKAVVSSSSVIIKPMITEKAALLSEQRGYTFLVAPNATKNEIAKAIKAQYKVTPASVRTLVISKKKVMTRGRGKITKTGGGKKAYVYLKKGDKIEVL